MLMSFSIADPAAYAVQVFRTLDLDGSGAVTFKEFLVWLSTVSRGSKIDKLNWIFNLYDINGDGRISKDELNVIIRSVYQLMGDQINCNLTTKRLMSDSQSNDIFTLKVLKFFSVRPFLSQVINNSTEYAFFCRNSIRLAQASFHTKISSESRLLINQLTVPWRICTPLFERNPTQCSDSLNTASACHWNQLPTMIRLRHLSSSESNVHLNVIYCKMFLASHHSANGE